MKGLFKRLTVGTLAVLLLTMVPLTGVNAQKGVNEVAEEQISDLTEYIDGLVLANGAFPMSKPTSAMVVDTSHLETVDGVAPEVYTKWPFAKIVPYFSQLSILGMLKTSPEQAKEPAERFIGWYFAHLNDKTADINGVDGTVYDYYCFVDPKDKDHIVEVTVRQFHAHQYPANPADNPYDYDSTDSYAACFLRVLYEYHKNYGGDFLTDKKEEVLRVLNALKSTYVPALGLTGAKPNYMVCYLMDNCEVYDGLVAASKLMEDLYGDKALAEELAGLAETVKAAIKKHLWSEENGAYYPYVFADGNKPAKPDWNIFYPDAAAQLFPISAGVIDPAGERAEALYEKFNRHFGTREKGWQVLKTGDTFPWASIAGVAATMGDYERLETYIRMIRTTFGTKGYPYPFYNSEAGAMLGMLKTYTESAYYKETYLETEPSEAESEGESKVETLPESTAPTPLPTEESTLWKILLPVGAGVVLLAGLAVWMIRKKKK
ncbi:MAG: hypothetical protein IKK06_01350 [Clostridia bacterium]|nr:hypothetical protein [Clostridia bacterium]